MTIQKIKSNIRSRMGQEVVINYSGSRNRKEFYRGTIKEIYDKLFIVKLDNGLKKSFSYADLLIGVLEIRE